MSNSSTPYSQPSVAILICTYKRAELLERCIKSVLANQYDGHIRYIVVDNDPEKSGQQVCSKYPLVTYRSETRPGITHARNTAISCVLDSDFLIFVDDDEIVSEEWVSLLVSTAVEYGADLVAGPTLSNLPDDCPSWVRKAGLFSRQRYRTGVRRPEAAAGNLLFRTSVFSNTTESAWFKPEFALTGGEDAEFTRRLVGGGASIVWCDEAWALEHVPLSRTTALWLIRRQMRIAGVDFRLRQRRCGDELFFLTTGLIRIFVGSFGLALKAISTKQVDGRYFRMLFRGVGFTRAVFGSMVVEYRR